MVTRICCWPHSNRTCDEYASAIQQRLRAKLGLATARDGDTTLIDDWLRLLAADRVDHTIAWRRLGRLHRRLPQPTTPRCATCSSTAQPSTPGPHATGSGWRPKPASMPNAPPAWRARIRSSCCANHLAEQAIRAAQEGDFSETGRLLKVLQHPYDEQPEHEAYAGFPPDWAAQLEVSCSS